MPIPVNGVGQHYSMAPDEYFQHHDTEVKRLGAFRLLARAEELTGGKGKVLDIGAGRGEVLLAAVTQGWSAVGIEPSESFAERASRNSGWLRTASQSRRRWHRE